MSDKVSPSTEYTGPGSRNQGMVSKEQNGNGSELYMLVLKDIVERAEFGARKYGQPLRTTAGVDYATNAYQEVLDLLIYFRGEIERNRKLHDLLVGARELLSLAAKNDVDLAAMVRHWLTRYEEYLPGNSEASLTTREDSDTL